MTTKAVNWGICWDAVAAKSVVANQRWVLSAMQKHGPALVTVLWRILANEQDVCDAYQDTFLKLAHYQDGQKPQKVKPFVFRTATNVAISMLRRKKLQTRAHRVVADHARQRPRSEGIADMDAKELQQLLRTNIARLPDRLQRVVVLKDLAELPYSQVATALGISVGTTRVYRCRAIRLLNSWMAQQEEE